MFYFFLDTNKTKQNKKKKKQNKKKKKKKKKETKQKKNPLEIVSNFVNEVK